VRATVVGPSIWRQMCPGCARIHLYTDKGIEEIAAVGIVFLGML
jgi:hypothetical protein